MNTAKFCTQCGGSLNPDTHLCTRCGAKIESDAQSITPEIQSPKSAVTALLLCLFLGTIGVHRFYVGKIGTGILMIITGGGLGIWTLIDLIRIACCEFRDKQDRPLIFTRGRTSPTKVKWIIGGVFGAIVLLVALIIAMAFYATSGLSDTIQNQLTALRSGDLDKAYSYTSKDFQKAITLDHFKQFINEHPSFKDNKTSSFTERSVENDKGMMKGTLESTDGTKIMVEYRLVKEGDIWKILVIQIIPPEVGTGTSSSTNTPVTLPNVFEDKNNKYSINYPADWTYKQENKGSVFFNGNKGTPSAYSTLRVQVVHIKKAVKAGKIIMLAVEGLKKQITTKASDVKVLSEGVVQLPSNPKKYQGKYFIVTYTYMAKQYKKMQVILQSEDGLNLYSWGFTAPVEQFPNALPTVRAMFESWKID